ncbi:diguanylate cyclase, partial [Mesorhizobium sp. M00.F.Ca.ET.186.01.1.1]
EDGVLIPQEIVTTQEAEPGQAHIHQLVSRVGNTPVTSSVLDDHRVIIVPVSLNDIPLYALFMHLPPEEKDCVYDVRDIAFLQEVAEKSSCALWRAIMSDDLRREASKKDLLYQLMSKIQASIDVNDVLHEIVTSIPSLYPYFSVELFLTVEPNATTPVKQLS